MSFPGFPAPPVSGTGTPPSPGSHNLLSSTHGDTLTATPGLGDIIVCSSSGEWSKLLGGAELDHLVVVGGVPEWTSQAGSGLGDVTGPVSATDNAIARFNQTSGKIIQNSQVLIDDDGNMWVAGNTIISGDLTVLGLANINLEPSGFVVGPTSSTDRSIAIYDGITGKLVQDSLVTISSDGDLTAAGDITASGNMFASGHLVVDGDIVGNSNANIAGDVNVVGDTNVGGNAVVSGDLTVLGSVNIDLEPSGFVVGPASSTDSSIAIYDGTTGKLIEDSLATISPNGDITAGGDITASGTIYASGDLIVNGDTTVLGDTVLTNLTVNNDVSVSGSLIVASGLSLNVTLFPTDPSNVVVADYYCVINATGLVTVNLPSSPTSGQTHIIKDGAGDAGTYDKTITPAAGTIDGSSTLPLIADYAAASVFYDGSEWKVF